MAFEYQVYLYLFNWVMYLRLSRKYNSADILKKVTSCIGKGEQHP